MPLAYRENWGTGVGFRPPTPPRTCGYRLHRAVIESEQRAAARLIGTQQLAMNEHRRRRERAPYPPLPGHLSGGEVAAVGHEEPRAIGTGRRGSIGGLVMTRRKRLTAHRLPPLAKAVREVQGDKPERWAHIGNRTIDSFPHHNR